MANRIKKGDQVVVNAGKDKGKQGEVVRVTEIAPMSKTKNWRVVEVITRAAE